MNHRLVLLVGMPRSGTSWIGKIFDSHPDVLYRHEPDTAFPLKTVPLLAPVSEVQNYRREIEAFVGALYEMRLTKIAASLPVFPKSYYSYPRFLLRQCAVAGIKLAARYLGELPVPDGIDYIKIPQLSIVWKSIDATGRLGVICRTLPQCRAVLILRHPCGYIASMLRGESRYKFTSRTPSYEDYGVFELLLKTEQARARGLTLPLLKSLSPVERLAWRWLLFNEKAMDDTEGLENYTAIRYEDVCQKPFEKSRGLFDFAGLSWNAQTDGFIRKSTALENSAYYSIFKNPLHSANKWKRELSQADIERVAAIVKDSKPGGLFFES